MTFPSIYHMPTFVNKNFPFFTKISDREICPVQMFEIYMSKINKNFKHLWQWPKKEVDIMDAVWYDNVPLGVNKIGGFMKQLSEDAQLSKIYTNHSICATCITYLDQAGFKSRHIMAVSSHKSETTVKPYAKKCPEMKKRAMSSALAEKITPAAKVPKNEELIQQNPAP